MRTRSLPPLLLAALASGSAAAGVAGRAPEAPEATEEALDRGLAEVRGLLDAQKWEDALEALEALLATQPEEEWVLRRWAEIDAALASAVFWSGYEPPEPEDVVDGDLLSWKPSSGKIKLRYRKGDGGLAFADTEPEAAQRGRAGDFIRAGEKMVLHPLVFTGPYHVEVEGGSHSRSTVPIVLVAWNWTSSLQGLLYGESYAVAFNRADITSLLRLEDGEFEPLETSFDTREDHCKITVKSTSIAVYSGRKQLFKAKRPKGEYGQFGLFDFDFDNIEEIVITGEVEPSWISGLLDARIQRDWKEFREGFSPFDHLPAWMKDRVLGSAKRAADPDEVSPRPVDPRNKGALRRARELLEEEEFEEGLKYVESLDDDEVTAPVRDWLHMQFLLYTGESGQALSLCEKVAEADPEFYEAGLMRARLMNVLRTPADARYALEDLALRFPEYVDTYEDLAMLHMLAGEFGRAAEIVGEAIANGVPPDALKKIGRTLYRSEHGPRWGEKFVHTSKYYVVSSDLSMKACYEISGELEKFYKKYINRIRRPKRTDEKFRVYFFSGRDGYLDYTGDILGRPSESTWGVYSPWLRQLVIWNSYDKRKVMETVRHEGFHQYFHRITDSEPRWLNEGMALYYMQARLIDGRWKDDAINREYAAILAAVKQEEWTPLKDLVHGDARAFMTKAGLHYPQAWAFVHFLYNSKKEEKERIETLLDALEEGLSREEALERAFADADWQAMDSAFREHVLSMDRD